VASIRPGAEPLPTLVDALLTGALGIRLADGPRDFSATTIFVPTRRSARALAAAFTARLRPSAVILPAIVPLGDPTDIEERLVLGEALAGAETAAGDLPPAVSPLQRRLVLMRLIDGWRRALAESGAGLPQIAATPGDAFALAGDLAGLIDEFTIEGLPWTALSRLVPEVHDAYWGLTTGFLRIAGEAWPGHLAEEGLIDAADRRDRLLRAEAVRLVEQRPQAPMIVLGSTGTVPATAALMAAICRLPNGAVVLPGLDQTLDAAGWAAIATEEKGGAPQPGHPQAMLKRLLARLGVAREDVLPLGDVPPARAARAAILSEAARPAETTDLWPERRQALAADFAAALADVAVIEAADEREEALAVAVALRGALEEPGRTAALVTPDRALATAVAGELRRWGIVADDSAGRPLAGTTSGTLARLVLALAEEANPLTVMEVLRHPAVRLGHDRPSLVKTATALEIGAFRGALVAAGWAGLHAAVAAALAPPPGTRHSRPKARVRAEALAEAGALLQALAAAIAPLTGGTRDLGQWAATLGEVLGTLTAGADDALPELGADAAMLDTLLDEIAQGAGGAPQLTLADAASILGQALHEAVVTEPAPASRVAIWGLLEARLLQADTVVLGGLSEGIWPPIGRGDAFLNRPMRAVLGLPSPERRIGQSAHDFAQGFAAGRVILSRAASVDGTPMVASRLLRRLDALLGREEARALRQRGQHWLGWARALDRPDGPPKPALPPLPRPPVALRPVRLSFTEIETLYRDPYAIFARHVLKLDELEPLQVRPGASDRGNLIHNAFAEFQQAVAEAWPADPLALLTGITRRHFEPYRADPELALFWWPQFETMARWFIGVETRRRGSIARVHAEVGASHALTLADGSTFTLTGRADRLDALRDGTIAIIDYKTGMPPSEKEVRLGLQPQLVLEAALAKLGAFAGIAPASVSEIMYWKLSGRGEGRERRITFADTSIDEAARQQLGWLVRTLERYRDEATPYASRIRLKLQGLNNRYDHLARAAEWEGGHDADE
jgi:ATP-dependent helicase/nuclease subunit B